MYYVFETHGPSNPCRWIDEVPFIEDMDFDLGIKVPGPVPNPLTFTLLPLNPNANDHGPEMPAFFNESIPLFSQDLIDSMVRAGVDNLDLYDAEISDPDSGEIIKNYKAANIIGLIAAANMEESNATIHPGGPIIDADFDGLVVDESRARGALIFRLAESAGTILIHKRLRDHLLFEGFDKLDYLDPKQCAL